MKVFLVLVTLSILFANTEGLKCYNCVHLSDQLPDGLVPKYGTVSEPSCQDGKNPEKRLSIDCSRIDYRKTENGTGTPNALIAILGDNLSLLNSPNQANLTEVTYACVKLSYDDNFGSEWGGKRITAMFRSCIRKFTDKNENFQQECHIAKMNKLNITDSEVNNTVFSDALGPLMNNTTTDVGICTCTDDDCNGVIPNARVSIVVMVSSILATLVKQNV